MTPALVNTPVLQTDRLILRAPEPGDGYAWLDYMIHRQALSERFGLLVFAAEIGHWVLFRCGSFFFVDRVSGETLGCVHLSIAGLEMVRRMAVRIFDEEDEGRGYATEAAGRVLEWIWNDHGVTIADCVVSNDAGRRVAQKLGGRHDRDHVFEVDEDGEAISDELWLFERPRVLS